MSIAEKLTTIAENQQKVYETGQTAEWNSFWDNYLGHITTYNSNCSYLFAGPGWKKETFKPNKDIVVCEGKYMFHKNPITGSLSDILEECGIVLDTSQMTSSQYMFASSAFSEISVAIPLVFTSSDGAYMFSGCSNLISLTLTVGPATAPHTSWFNNSTALENLTIVGTLTKTGLSVYQCTLLTHDSLLSIINALYDYTGNGETASVSVRLGSANIAKLTDDELAQITAKGWTYT